MILVDMHLHGVDTALEATEGTFGFHDDRSLLLASLSTELKADTSCSRPSLLVFSSYMIMSAADMIGASGLDLDI